MCACVADHDALLPPGHFCRPAGTIMRGGEHHQRYECGSAVQQRTRLSSRRALGSLGDASAPPRPTRRQTTPRLLPAGCGSRLTCPLACLCACACVCVCVAGVLAMRRAGLGGGSSDAAAALRGLNKLWNLGLSLDELTEIGAEIGSDVPFLVRGGTALVQGRGEDVTPINPAAVPKFLILTPEVVLEHSTAKTASVFSHVKESMFTRGNLTHKLAARIRAAGDCPPEFFFNQFGTISEELFPGWNKDRDLIMSFGARDVMLCGAGPSMFTIPSSKELGTAWHLLLSTVHRKRSFLVGPAIAISEGTAA